MNKPVLHHLPMRPDTAPSERLDEADDRVARLERELLKLGARCRAREHALDRLSGAVLTLRRANTALTEENSLLRLELERQRRRMTAEPEAMAASKPVPFRAA